MVVARSALTGCEVEAPPVKGADKVVTIDFTEGCEVGVAMRATSLHDEVTNDDVIGVVTCVATGRFALRFRLRPAHTVVVERL